MIFSPYDVALARRDAEKRPVRVAILGAGNLARMISLQLSDPAPPGIRLVCLANRTLSNASALMAELGVSAKEVSSDATLADCVRSGAVAITDNPTLVATSSLVDVLVDATGSVDYSLSVVLAAIEARKHIVLANAELDSTLGPVLSTRAQAAGVVYTNIDGDEPGVAMNLVRYTRSIGLRPVAAGNLKGMIDPYRNPETQAAFAREHGQNPRIVTSFADGTKLSMELAILANATGFKVGQPGMYGPECKHVQEIADLLPSNEMLKHGLVDYALGAAPHTGAFVVVHEGIPARKRLLKYLKMGDGPFYVFYTPYHLPHIQAVATIGRAVETNDPTVAPLAGPVCQVIAHAKKPLAEGESLDGPGGFTCFGKIENVQPASELGQGLPVALSHGCILKRALSRDDRITLADVDVPETSLAIKFWRNSLA